MPHETRSGDPCRAGKRALILEMFSSSTLKPDAESYAHLLTDRVIFEIWVTVLADCSGQA